MLLCVAARVFPLRIWERKVSTLEGTADLIVQAAVSPLYQTRQNVNANDNGTDLAKTPVLVTKAAA